MNTAEILAYAAQHDIHLEANGDRLVVDAPKGALTRDLRYALKTHKPELLSILSLEVIAKRYGLSLLDLREVAGSDWDQVRANLALAESFANAVATRRMRERGKIPPDYTTVTECAGCGRVPIWAGVPDRVLACPWCFNRVQGRPIPQRHS